MQNTSPDLSWLHGFGTAPGPRYLRIVDLLEQGIADGGLHTGDRLPSQRAIAEHLGVDLTTVTRAFDEARKRQLLAADGARGTFVAAPKVELAPVVDLRMNIPPPPADVDLEELLRQGLAHVLRHADIDLLMTYHRVGGSAADREAGARWLAPMLGPVAADSVTSCPGAQAALAAVILATTQPGDTVLCEPMNYPGLRAAAQQLGRRVRTIATDDEGMLPDALDAACREPGARLLYLNPTIQNPTTVTVPEPRRRALLDVATRHDLQMLEDDPYWLMASDAPPPFAQLAPGRVHYVSTLSKCLCPGLRTAFVRSPDPRRQADFLAALRSFSLMRAPLTTLLATQWLHDGTAAALVAGVKEEARARQRLAAQVLGALPAGPHASREGIHLWLPLPSYWTAREFAQAARAGGLAVTPADAFAGAERIATQAIRLSLGEGRDRQRLERALRRLSMLLASPPDHEESALV